MKFFKTCEFPNEHLNELPGHVLRMNQKAPIAGNFSHVDLVKLRGHNGQYFSQGFLKVEQMSRPFSVSRTSNRLLHGVRSEPKDMIPDVQATRSKLFLTASKQKVNKEPTLNQTE